MNDHIFLKQNFDSKILVVNESSGMAGTNDFVITDLEKVSQVKISKEITSPLVKFIIQNMEDEKDTRTQLLVIANECKVRELIFKKSDLQKHIDKFKTSLVDKEKDEYYVIDKTDSKYSDTMKAVLIEYVSMHQLIKDIIMSDKSKEMLSNKNIHLGELGNLVVKGFGNSSTSRMVVTGASKEFVKIENVTWERKKYIESQQTV